MMWVGFACLWFSSIYMLRTRASSFVETMKKKDRRRVASLQNRLNQNFIFSEKNRILLMYIFLPFLWIKIIEHLRYQKFQRQLLILIPSISSMLRAGHGIEKSLSEVKKTIPPPMCDEIQLMLNEMQLGAPLDESLLRLKDRFKSDNLQMFVYAVIISRKLGSSLSEAIDHIAVNVMEKEKLKQQIMALTSQGKMQSYIAVCMPFMLGFVLQWISPGYFDLLFSTTLGKLSIVYSIVSMSVGLFWIYKISHKEYL